MSYSITPAGDFEYTVEGEVHQVTPEQVGEPTKTADRSFKDDTETWSYQYEATLVDDTVVTWSVDVEVGYTPFHETNSSGVQGLPDGFEVESDPEFECKPEED